VLFPVSSGLFRVPFKFHLETPSGPEFNSEASERFLFSTDACPERGDAE